MTVDEAKSDLKILQVLDKAIMQGKISVKQVRNFLPMFDEDFEGTKELINGFNDNQVKSSSEETANYTQFLIKKKQLENFINNNSK